MLATLTCSIGLSIDDPGKSRSLLYLARAESIMLTLCLSGVLFSRTVWSNEEPSSSSIARER